MFEVGKNYEFRMMEGGDEVTFWGTVEKYEHPLIKLTDSHFQVSGAKKAMFVPGRIINVTSTSFNSAVQKTEM